MEYVSVSGRNGKPAGRVTRVDIIKQWKRLNASEQFWRNSDQLYSSEWYSTGQQGRNQT